MNIMVLARSAVAGKCSCKVCQQLRVWYLEQTDENLKSAEKVIEELEKQVAPALGSKEVGKSI